MPRVYSLDHATGEGLILKIKDKEYKTTPLKMKHLGELKARIRSQMVLAAREASDATNPYLQNDLIAKVVTAPLGMGTISEEMSSPDILQWLIWRCISVNNPEFSIHELDDMSMTGLDELASVLGNVFGDSEDTGQTPEEKSPPPPPQHR